MKTLVLVPSHVEWQILLGASPQCSIGGFRCMNEVTGLVWALCGVGPCAAGVSAVHLTQRTKADRVILVGVAGAYPDSGFGTGDIVQATSECFADLGHTQDERIVNLDHQKFPMLVGHRAHWGCNVRCEVLDPAEPKGQFGTVSTVTTNRRRALMMQRTFGVDCENMEGAAVGHACRLESIPFYQVRAISNMVGPRDRLTWSLKDPLIALKRWLAERLHGVLA